MKNNGSNNKSDVIMSIQKECVENHDRLLNELTILENLSPNYSRELLVLSKDIRNHLWNDNNTDELFSALHLLNPYFVVFFSNNNCVELIFDYVNYLSLFIQTYDNRMIFEKIRDDIYLENAKKISEKWDNVLNSNDEKKSFVDFFDDIFSNGIEKLGSPFIVELTSNDVLCRTVKEKDCDENRFIPWLNKTNNRWNPPGKTYLYLSYGKEDCRYNDYLTLGEYVCLLECRTKPGEDCCFARFEPKVAGRILDLSYNDTTLHDYRKQLSEYKRKVETDIFYKLTKDEELIKEARKLNEAKARALFFSRIKEIYKSEYSHENMVKKNLTSQILKMICSSIFTKVDEETEEGKERAYRLFHLLSNYLEDKGITGIIYPCTRTNKVAGKNIVLFNIHDAEPIKGTIKKYHHFES